MWAGMWLLDSSGLGRLQDKETPQAFDFHDLVAQRYSTPLSLMSRMKEGLSQQPQPMWCCPPTSFVTDPEKNTLRESGVVAGCQSSYSRLFGKPRLEDHLPPAPTLSTGRFLSRCQGKLQAVLENGRETSLKLQQWAEWDYRAWSVPLWKSNKCTP